MGLAEESAKAAAGDEEAAGAAFEEYLEPQRPESTL